MKVLPIELAARIVSSAFKTSFSDNSDWRAASVWQKLLLCLANHQDSCEPRKMGYLTGVYNFR